MLTELIARVEPLEERVKSSGACSKLSLDINSKLTFRLTYELATKFSLKGKRK